MVMKKTRKLFMAVSDVLLAAMAFMAPTSCSDAVFTEDAPLVSEYTFSLESIAGPDTRTSLTAGDVIAWNSTDSLGTYASGSSNLKSVVIPGAPATFRISLSQSVTAGEQLYFYYPYNASAGSDPASARLSIPSSQSGDLSSLPMAALPYTATQAFASGTEIPSLRFCPLGSIIEFSIYSDVTEYRSEKVQSVTFKAQDGIAGQFTYDLTAVDRGNASSLSISGLSGTAVTVTPPAAVSVGTSRSTATPIYMTVAPGTHAGTLTVTTDKASYTYDLDSRSFERNVIRPMAVRLSESVRTLPCYRRVTSVSAVTDGKYVIAGKSGSIYYAMPSSMEISRYNKVNGSVVTVTDDVVTCEDAEGYVVDIKVTNGIATISNGTSYLAHTDSTKLALGEVQFGWTVTPAAGDTVRLASSLDSKRCLLFRQTTYNCFGAYSTGSFKYGGYSEILLFKYESAGGSSTPDTPATPDPSIVTGNASAVTETGATLSATFYNTTSTPREIRFEYGTSATALNSQAYYNDVVPANGSSFSVTLSSLAPATTYYYRAVMQLGSEDVYGQICSFTTLTPSATSLASWLELPALNGDEDYVGTFRAGNERNYSYYYDYDSYAALWVAYPLCKSHTSGSGGSKTWNYNPNISQTYQVSITSSSYPSKYNASEYARGHQIPNADRLSSSTMNGQTYYATNQTPQLQEKFNAAIWGSLEGAIRSNLPTSDTVYVATGPVFRKVGGSETISYLTGASIDVNPAKLPVPNYYWKAVLKVKRSGSTITSACAVGFWFEHKEYSNTSYANYTVTVDQIEAWTGLDLFTNLPDTIEASAESNSSWTTFTSF